MTDTPLAGLRVLELGAFIAGPFAGQLLGDLGAEVVKVEPPTGHVTRRIGPFHGDEPGPESSIFFWQHNRGKQSVTLDLDRPDDAVLSEESKDDPIRLEDGVLAIVALAFVWLRPPRRDRA